MNARPLLIAIAVVATSACPPPFDTLPFPGEGEGGEGEGEGEGEGACPAVVEPTCSTAFATELDAWTPIDVTTANDGAVTALAVDAATSTIVIGDVNGNLYRFNPSTSATPTLLATCPAPGSPPENGPVIARRIFVLVDGTIVASGTNGVCVVNADGSNPFVTFLGDENSENAVVPVGSDFLAVSITGADYNFMHFARAGTTLNFVANIATETRQGNVVNAIATPNGDGALVADEAGAVYFVDSTFASVDVVATLDGAAAPSGVVLAAIADDVEIALMTSSDVQTARIALSELEAETSPLTAIPGEQLRDPARFTSEIDRTTAIALRTSDTARLDVGTFGYATYATSSSGPAPIGACTRVSALSDIAATTCGTAWGVTLTGGVVAWNADAFETDAVAFSATSIGATTNFAAHNIVPLDDTHALLGGGGGFSVMTKNGAAIDVVELNDGPPCGGFAVGASRVVAVGIDGSAVAFDPLAANPRNTLQPLTGSTGTDVTSGGGLITDLVATTDPGATSGDTAAFFVAANVGGVATLRHCSADLVGRTFACDKNAPIAFASALAVTYSDITVTSSAEVVVVTNVGPAFSPDAGTTAVPVATTALAPGDTPWDEGNGRIVDAGNGCIFVAGFAANPYVFNAFDTAPAISLTSLPATNPFLSVAALVDDGKIVASGGNGGSFAEISFDTNTALPCATRFSHATLKVLGPSKPAGDLTSAVFVGDDAYAGDDAGILWKLPRF